MTACCMLARLDRVRKVTAACPTVLVHYIYSIDQHHEHAQDALPYPSAALYTLLQLQTRCSVQAMLPKGPAAYTRS